MLVVGFFAVCFIVGVAAPGALNLTARQRLTCFFAAMVSSAAMVATVVPWGLVYDQAIAPPFRAIAPALVGTAVGLIWLVAIAFHACVDRVTTPAFVWIDQQHLTTAVVAAVVVALIFLVLGWLLGEQPKRVID